jgi:small conductance mechanosensitive channel
MDINAMIATATAVGTSVGLKLLGALALWIIGRWAISIIMSLSRKGMEVRKVDATLVTYMLASISVALNIALAIAILGVFGIETTSFAALLAAAGIAIGAAWAGLLSNFAAGIFLIILRPFKVGDFISVGGVTGTVRAIGLFGTTIDTPDNVLTIIGNNKVFSDNIQNFSANAYRRVDLTAQLNGSVDHRVAIALLKAKVAAIPNVIASPAPDVEISTFTMAGPVLVVRPYTHTDHYWQVYFDTNRVIRESFAEAGFPAPETQYVVTNRDAAA